MSRCTARPGSWSRPWRSSEGGGEALEAAILQERPQAQLLAGAVAQHGVALAARPQRGRHVVLVLVDLDEAVDGGVRDVAHAGHQVADAVAVDGEAEAQLGRHLVALGDGDLAHVVAEAGEARALQVVPGVGRASPGGQPLPHLGVGAVPDDDLPSQAHAGVQEARLAVAVGGLVEVHEVHVDGVPGQVAVVLGVQVAERLGQRREAGDPHAGGGEGVHPQDQARAVWVGVRREAGATDLLGRGDHGPKRTGSGMAPPPSSVAARCRALAATSSSGPGPYRCCEPQTSQISGRVAPIMTSCHLSRSGPSRAPRAAVS
jgi:hypothetical protein